LLAVAGLWLSAGAIAPDLASAKPATCLGTGERPGALSGVYTGNVIVQGVCYVDAGPAVVRGTLTIGEHSILVAAFAFNDFTGSGNSKLTVYGNVRVEGAGGLYMGCEPQAFPCLDNPEANVASRDRVFGNVSSHEPLGVIIHASEISGTITERGGGGGATRESCEPAPGFPFGYYSDYEDLKVHGNLIVTGLESCWFGLARDNVVGNVRLKNDNLADPDAIEVLANKIGGNLNCRENSRLWNSAEAGEEGLFPRVPEPNTVAGKRSGQCVYSSPETEEALEKGEFGSGPF